MDHNFEEGFHKEEFLSKVNFFMIKFYKCISSLNIEDIRHFFSEEIYRKYIREIEKEKEDNKRILYENVDVKSTITGGYQDSDYYYLEVLCDCSYLKKNLSNDNSSIFETHPVRLLFRKKKGVISQEIPRCSGCGTTLNIQSSGKCSNCGRIYDLANYDYIIIKMNE